MKVIEDSRVTDLSLILIPLNFHNQILSHLSNITSLRIDGFFIHPVHHKIFNFPNLKYLNAIDGESFLNCIGQNQIETLKISFIKSYIWGALERLNKLKDLTIFGFFWRTDRGFENFQLKTLTLAITNGAHEPALEWNLKNGQMFLDSQKNHLQEFIVEYDDMIESCNELLSYALNNMNLKRLYTLYSINGSNGVFKINEQLKDLTIELPRSTYSENVIACCPAVEKIDLSHTELLFEYMLPLVSKQMKFLKHMKLVINRPDYFERVDKIDAKFDNILSLDVNMLFNTEFHHLTKVVTCMPNLKRLKIRMIGMMKWNFQDFSKFLTAIANVKEIYCNGDLGLTDFISEILVGCVNSLKLRSLQIKVDHPEKFIYLKEKLLKTNIRLVIMKKFPVVY